MLSAAMAPAPGFDDRARPPTFDIERVVPRVGVDLYDAGVVRELPLRVFTFAGRRVVVHRRRRRLATKGPIVTHMTPQTARAAFALGQDWYRCVVDVNALGRVHVRLDHTTPRPQCRSRCADPVGQCGNIELNALACIDLALPIERQVRAVLAKHDFRQQLRTRTTARDRMRRGGSLRHRLTGAATELLHHVFDHLPMRGHALQRFRYLLADLAQVITTAARACLGCWLHASLSRQVCWQGTTRGLSALLRSCCRALLLALCVDLELCRDLFRRRILYRQLDELTELQLKLVDEPGVLRRWTEPSVLKLGNRELEVLDLGVEKFGPGLGLESALVRGDHHRLQRCDVVGKL